MVNQNLHQQFHGLVQKYKFQLDKTQLLLDDSFNLDQQHFSEFVEFLYNETQVRFIYFESRCYFPHMYDFILQFNNSRARYFPSEIFQINSSWKTLFPALRTDGYVAKRALICMYFYN